MGPGQKAKLLTLIDNERADRVDIQPLYSIDITVGVSPKNKVKCGALTLFRLNKVAQDFEDKLTPKNFKPEDLIHARRRAQEISDDLNTKTEAMSQDPIFFRSTDGRWLPWAVDEALRMYDRVGGAAKITLKCPSLRIKVVRSPHQIAVGRSNIRDLFPVIKRIDQLLERGYSHDPWNNVVRRGRIGAEESKR
tara:strand:- start:3012 stop:3590 length:579 start_codon:yes stop_codon:yes gene_type:complete